MTIEEMKELIVEKVNQLENENALHEVLKVLNEKPESKKEIDVTKHIDVLFQKHDGLLKRLS